MITNENVWPIVKLRLGLADETLKPLIETYISEIERRIKHYCSIQSLPNDLLFTWVSMTIDAVRVDLPNVDEIEDTVGAGVNVKVGDTSVSNSSAAGVTNVSKSVIDTLVLNYAHDLNRYRKLRW